MPNRVPLLAPVVSAEVRGKPDNLGPQQAPPCYWHSGPPSRFRMWVRVVAMGARLARQRVVAVPCNRPAAGAGVVGHQAPLVMRSRWVARPQGLEDKVARAAQVGLALRRERVGMARMDNLAPPALADVVGAVGAAAAAEGLAAPRREALVAVAGMVGRVAMDFC